ncbi:hypothetical protein A7K50_08670 [Dehalobacter sp. MCB1]|nr:hypothetical protein A7K50_08670 [Dehalobacter sp. MCB1]TCX53047.1 hypothetical protein C1I38_08305 [Dehalobacter sp. 12DCB1]
MQNIVIQFLCKTASQYINIDNFLLVIQKYTEINELNSQILNELIQKIVVYEKSDNPGGSKSKRMDIS